MSDKKKALEVIKNLSATSLALNPTRKCVLNEPSSDKSSISSDATSENSWRDEESSVKKKAKKQSSTASSKEKEVKKGAPTKPKRSKRNHKIVSYKEHPEKKNNKKKDAKKNKPTKKFFRVEDMRVDEKDRMRDDFEDFVVEEGKPAYLIHKKSVEEVMVEEIKGGSAKILQESEGVSFWVKRTQLLGNFDGETREGRVGLYKKGKSLPTLVMIIKSDDHKCEVKNFNDGDEATSYTVFTNQVSMAAPSTLRNYLKKDKIASKKKKANLDKRHGNDFSFQEFLKTQAERDEARNNTTMQIVKDQSAMFETMMKSQQAQFAALIAVLGSGRSASAGISNEKEDDVDNKAASKDSANNDD